MLRIREFRAPEALNKLGGVATFCFDLSLLPLGEGLGKRGGSYCDNLQTLFPTLSQGEREKV
jgi:hypothetical protein